MKLILVRHGETKWNREMRFQGKTDNPLSKRGLEQAKILAKRLVKEKIDVIYTSKLKRATKSAEIIKKFHRNARLIKAKELNEISWGLWEGLTKSEVKKKYPEMSKEREKDKFNFKVPQGESLKILKNRIRRFLSKIIKRDKNKSILFVGHGNVNKNILGILLKWNNKRILSTGLHNASITILNIRNNKAEIQLFNSTEHLIGNHLHDKSA